MILLLQSGFEALAERELAQAVGATPGERGPGWLLRPELSRARVLGPGAVPLAFPHWILLEPAEIRGESVNGLAGAILDWFLASVRDEQIGEPWPLWWDGPAEITGLGRRVGSVEAAFAEALRKRMSRVARLASPAALPVRGFARGLFVYFVDFQRAYVARAAWRGGQRRMADDPAAPSRSYLKVEEAYGILGREPAPDERVADLGAAPGGWSYSAARRGARVVAVDNGPLKAGAAAHPRIEHRRADAFRFAPEPDAPFDWLFCDLVEEPHHVMAQLLRPWCERGWCRRYVVNLKFGRVDPIALLAEMRALRPEGVIRHLYHDREEFTVVEELPFPP